jgi:hypothetical protein
MPTWTEWTSWDLLFLIDCWNLYALPTILVVTAIVVILRQSRRTSGAGSSRRIVDRLGLIHYLLSLSFLIAIAQEWLSGGATGPQILLIKSLYAPLLSVVVNALLGFGLRRLSRRARLAAILWNAVWTLIALISMTWRVYYHATIDPARWPDDIFVAKLLPMLLFILLLLPPVKRVFDRSSPDDDPRENVVISLLALVALIILASTLTIDIADWTFRVAFPSAFDML